MSRLLIKNLSPSVSQHRLRQIFSKLGTVTDCSILHKGSKSRNFCFIGYKTEAQAVKAKEHFNGSYVGTSKVQVEMAKTKDVLNKEKREKGKEIKEKTDGERKQAQNVNQARALGKFQEYKRIVDKGSKQSWNDLVIGNEMLIQQPEIKEKKRDVKKGVQEKKKEKQFMRDKQTAQALQTPQLQSDIKPFKQLKIKAPIFSAKNSKFIDTPLKVDQTRLYITNFSHDLTQSQLLSIFSAYGTVTKVKFPKDENKNKLKGFGFVTYSKPEESLRAFYELDNKIVYGRILHVKPALQDIGGIIKEKKEEEYQKRIREKFGDPQTDPSSYKKKQKIHMREKLSDTTSWNTLFLNPDTLVQHMADKHGVTRSEIFQSENLAAKIALAEAEVIAETREWLLSQGLNLDFMATDRNLCERSKVVLLIKNLHHNTEPENLKELFQFYGVVRRLMICPNKAIAIVEFDSQQFAKNALQKLSYYKYKSNPLYLEYAPINLMSGERVKEKVQQEKKQREYDEELGKILYVKNLNFVTEQTGLEKHFKGCGIIRKVTIIKDRTKPQSSNQTQLTPSMGYGFVQFSSKQSVIKALKQHQNSLLDGHTIQLSVSKGRKPTSLDKIKKRQGGLHGTFPKLSIKNISFKAQKGQLQQLFKQYGNVKKLNLPIKMDKTLRGFGFVEYERMEEAQLAFTTLGSVHLYGRKMVVEWAKGEE